MFFFFISKAQLLLCVFPATRSSNETHTSPSADVTFDVHMQANIYEHGHDENTEQLHERHRVSVLKSDSWIIPKCLPVDLMHASVFYHPGRK